MGASTLEGYGQRTSEGLLSYWWGPVSLESADEYRLLLSGWKGERLPALTLDGKPVSLAASDDGPAATAILDRGRHSVTLSGVGTLSEIEVKGSGLQTTQAGMLPADYSPPEGSIVVEAEKPSAEGEVRR